MDDLSDISHLKNEYFVLRHGESEANAAGLISSNLERGVRTHGLTPKGASQVTSSVNEAKRKGWLNNKTMIFSSDFKRAAETADIARQILNARPIKFERALRERDLGMFDSKKGLPYTQIWPRTDEEANYHKVKDVEGPQQILSRLARLINKLEEKYTTERLLLVTHGDIIQVLQAAFAGLSSKPEMARAIPYINQGEIRHLTFEATR